MIISDLPYIYSYHGTHMMCDNWNELSHLACATVNRGYQECGRPSIATKILTD